MVSDWFLSKTEIAIVAVVMTIATLYLRDVPESCAHFLDIDSLSGRGSFETSVLGELNLVPWPGLG